MSKDEIYEEIQLVKSKISCMAHYKGDISESVDFGFYLIMTELSEKLEELSNDVNELGEETCEKTLRTI